MPLYFGAPNTFRCHQIIRIRQSRFMVESHNMAGIRCYDTDRQTAAEQSDSSRPKRQTIIMAT